MDNKTFLLASTAVGAGIGWIASPSEVKPKSWLAGVVSRIPFLDPSSIKMAAVFTGAMLGFSFAATYLYVELLVKAFVWIGQGAINHPLITLTVGVGGVAIVVIASLDEDDKKPKRKNNG